MNGINDLAKIGERNMNRINDLAEKNYVILLYKK